MKCMGLTKERHISTHVEYFLIDGYPVAYAILVGGTDIGVDLFFLPAQIFVKP